MAPFGCSSAPGQTSSTPEQTPPPVTTAPAPCSGATTEDCETCGCPSGQWCSPEMGCVPLAGEGEPCDVDAQCNTNHCSDVAKVCRIPVGSPCTDQNCDLCVHRDEGWSYCSRYCSTGVSLAYEREVCNGGVCASVDGVGTCHQSCSGALDSSCPGDCHANAAGSAWSCTCDDCATSGIPRQQGQTCEESSQCQAGECWHPISSRGYCSSACTSSDECGEGLRCAEFSCSDGTCPRCAPDCSQARCNIGICRDVSTPEGAVASVCDLRKETGSCASGSECVSGECLEGSCGSAQKLQNGESCTSPTDCLSGNCAQSTCQGTTLLGESCEDSHDCAVGECCTAGSGTCETEC